MKKWYFVFCSLVLFQSALITSAYGDSAEVLPKGISNINISGTYYFNIDERYGPDGDTEDVDADFNATLDSGVFSDLGALESFFGMPAGSANIGDSVVNYDYDFSKIEISFMYGLTDNLTVGVRLPYWWIKNNVNAQLDTTNATIGKSATGVLFGAPLVPLAANPFGDALPLTTEDVYDLVGSGLDVNGDSVIDIPGYGYKRISSFSDNGIGDSEIGGRYQYLKNEKWQLAVTGGLRLPTGRIDDPNDLMDYGISDGAYALFLHANNDYTGFDKLVLNGTARYYAYLPDEETLRITFSADEPITPNMEEVERDLGDVLELELSGKYSFSNEWSCFGLYKYGHKWKDHISGDMGYNYDGLEDETDYEEHVYFIGLTYSTIQMYTEKKFPIPLAASISYRDRFKGENLFKSKYIEAAVRLFF
ncbi:hypothetical protein ACFLZ5_06140 [Thermodesulfobacteriota bacterium]